MTTENSEYALANTDIMTTAQNYIKAMSLPSEATASVLRTMQAAHVLRQMVDNQSKLPPELKRRLITSKDPISDIQLASTDSYCMANCFPYSFIAMIEGKIYPLAQGLNLKMMADPRILRSWEIVNKEVITVLGDKPGDPSKNYICRVTAKATFANGEFYISTGVCDIVELSQKRSKTQPTPANVELKAETRAKRRTCIIALAMTGMIIEESTDAGSDGTEQSGEVF